MTDDRPPQPPPTGTGEAGDAPGAGGTGAEPPPFTAFAWRNGLVRPTQGRLLAGVCGAFGRATNTDPVLWRVVIAVLTIFAGIGLLAYLIAWLILPADGDTASPLEALAGRGRSRTSTPLTIIGALIVVFSLAAYISEPFRATPLVAVALLGGVLLLLLRDQRRPRPANPATPPYAPPAAFPPPGAASPSPYPPSYTAPGHAPPGYGPPSYGPPSYGPTGQAPGVAPPAPVGYGPPTLTTPPPFAPHGPFVASPPPPVVPPPPRPKPPRSRLGGLTLSLVLIGLGTLTVLNLLGYSIPPLAYLAVALGLLGLGLLVGAWFGRARWLIVPGLVLALLVGGGSAATNANWPEVWHNAGDATWTPASLASVQESYVLGVGNATLDLSNVDFSDAGPVDIRVSVNFGSARVILPSDVDVDVDATVDIGDAQVFNERWEGLGQQRRTVSDLGHDGPGGGKLNLIINVHVGELDVTR